MELFRKIRKHFVGCKSSVIGSGIAVILFSLGLNSYDGLLLRQIKEHSYHGSVVLKEDEIKGEFTFSDDGTMVFIKLTHQDSRKSERIVYIKMNLRSLYGQALVNATMKNKTDDGYDKKRSELVSATLMRHAAQLIFIFNLRDFDVNHDGEIKNVAMVLFRDK